MAMIVTTSCVLKLSPIEEVSVHLQHSNHHENLMYSSATYDVVGSCNHHCSLHECVTLSPGGFLSLQGHQDHPVGHLNGGH